MIGLQQRMRTLTAAFALIVLLTSDRGLRADENSAPLSKAKLDAISKSLDTAVEKKQVAGASVLLAHHGKVVFTANSGMSDIESKSPMTEKVIQRIASMTKPITSVAVMILADEGKLKVTDPLSKFLPAFKSMKVLVVSKDGKSHELVDAAREITIHDLLTHSSGITYRLMNKPILGKMYVDAGVSDGISDTEGTVAQNIDKLAKLPLTCQPGAAWEYGLNTDVLGVVVETVSGKSLQDFIRERICVPLKMNDSWFILPKESRSRLSSLYLTAGGLSKVGGKPFVQDSIVFSANYPLNDSSKYHSGGGGMSATLGDYYRFCQMLLNRGQLDGVRVLKEETVSQMTRNQLGDVRIQFPGNDLMGYGFGILSEKGKEATKDLAGVGTYGWGGAFGTYFWIDPKNELIGVFMCQAFPPDFGLAQEFKRLTYEAVNSAK